MVVRTPQFQQLKDIRNMDVSMVQPKHFISFFVFDLLYRQNSKSEVDSANGAVALFLESFPEYTKQYNTITQVFQVMTETIDTKMKELRIDLELKDFVELVKRKSKLHNTIVAILLLMKKNNILTFSEFLQAKFVTTSSPQQQPLITNTSPIEVDQLIQWIKTLL
jgi:hypothetical protein